MNMEDYIAYVERMCTNWRSYLGKDNYKAAQVSGTAFTIDRLGNNEVALTFGVNHLGKWYNASLTAGFKSNDIGIPEWQPRQQDAARSLLLDIAKQMA